MLFFRKKNLDSEEFIKLRKLFEDLRIRVEGLIDEIAVFKAKYRRGRTEKKEETEEDEKAKGFIRTYS